MNGTWTCHLSLQAFCPRSQNTKYDCLMPIKWSNFDSFVSEKSWGPVSGGTDGNNFKDAFVHAVCCLKLGVVNLPKGPHEKLGLFLEGQNLFCLILLTWACLYVTNMCRWQNAVLWWGGGDTELGLFQIGDGCPPVLFKCHGQYVLLWSSSIFNSV